MSEIEGLIHAYREAKVLYVSQFETWGVFIWRPLGMDEVGMYEKLFATIPGAKADLEDQIFKDCVVEHTMPKEDFDEWQAGIVTTVANQILKISTAVPVEFVERLDKVRDLVGANLFYQIFAYIMRVFPSYSFEDLESMPLEIIMERLALAETITNEPMPIVIEKAPRIPHGAPIDFEAENRKLHEVDFAPPAGDFNLDRSPQHRGRIR